MSAPAGNQYAAGCKTSGRPTKYLDEYAEQARKLCQLGATDADLAQFFNVCIATIWQWSTRHQEFLSAIKLGKEAADDLMERSLYQRGRGFVIKTKKFFVVDKAIDEREVDEYYPPETRAAVIWLNNRRPREWRDRREVTGNITHDHEHTHRLSSLSPKEIDALPVDEVQARYAEALAVARGLRRLPSPDGAGDGPVQEGHQALVSELGVDE